MVVYQMFYLISIVLHFWALMIAMQTIHSGACTVFSQTKFSDLFSQCREKRLSELLYIATICGTATNVFFIFAKTGYIMLTDAHETGILEPLFIAGHLCAGVAFIVYHQITLEKTRDMVNEEVFG